MRTSRHEALQALQALQALGTATPRMVTRFGSALRTPYARLTLRALEAAGATRRVGSDEWALGPNADAVYAAANWCEDDGIADPGWNL